MTDVKPIAMRDAFLWQLHAAMKADESISLLSADFGSPVIDHIRSDFPGRFVNVGIAEQNLINIAAGLSLEGYKVFCYAIAPFITMRCFEQIRVNLALLSEVRDMNVNLVGVGAGYSYVVSGPTHQCYEDLSIMRSLPNIRVLSPSDHLTAADALGYAVERSGPKYLRFDAQVLPVLGDSERTLERGYRVLSEGGDLCLVATGYATHIALSVAAQLAEVSALRCQVVDVSRLDSDVSLSDVISGGRVVSIEEAFEGRGGLDAFVRSRISPGIRHLGVGVTPGYEFEIGTRGEIHEKVGIGTNAVCRRVTDWLETL